MMYDLYSQEFLYHFKNQPYTKKLEIKTHTGRDANFACGDEIEVELNVENGIIKDIGYKPDACAVAIAAASILADNITGKNLEEFESMSKEEFLNSLGIELTASRQKCALVGYNAIRNALEKE